MLKRVVKRNRETVTVTNLHRSIGISSDNLGSIRGEVTAEDSTGVSQSGLAHQGIHIPELQREEKASTETQLLMIDCFK